MNAMLDRLASGREAQRRFTSDAAHELRTPLMALLAELELAGADPSTIEPALDERLHQLAERLSLRVDDLVLLSTLDEAPPLNRRPVDLAALARAEAATMPDQPAVSVHGAATADADEPLVGRAVRNLLANARRHARSRVAVTISDDIGFATIDVDDDGPGIAPADRDTVIRRFARLDQARTADAGGAGLGLAIAASIADRHGGTLTLADSPLGGARCTLRLPLHPST
jgi:signal transduction histidine kinase